MKIITMNVTCSKHVILQLLLRLLSLTFLCMSAVKAQTSSTVADLPYYTAGVVEFRPTIAGMSSVELVEEHLQSYIEILHSAAASATDIIVFPEGTLNNALQLTYVPDASEMIIPCVDSEQSTASVYADFLVQLSCAVRNVRKYLVINLTEKENCSSTSMQDTRPCASNGLNIYNTNVVFDREGRVISRYRKVHVYLEAKNTTLQPEFAIFETDFGVRFGHFICFDILFYTPAQELVVRYGVQNLIFTSLFYSELPFLTAVQLQQAWAWGNNVNLLAAGASYPQSGTTGSGIYAGTRGSLASIMVTKVGVRQLLVAQIPKMSGVAQITHTDKATPPIFTEPLENARVERSDIKLMKDPQLELFKSELIDFTWHAGNVTRRLCDGNHCCNFHVLAELQTSDQATLDMQYYKYRIGVFNGARTYEKEEWSNLRVCALYACTSENISSCGEIFDADVQLTNLHFKAIHIEGDFQKAAKVLIMPTTLTDDLYTLPSEQVVWQIVEHGSHFNVNFNLSADCNKLLTFGIYANYYDSSAAAAVTQQYIQFSAALLYGVFVLLIAEILS